eukprot:11440172-Prorocentrum_lima.AAC.1
MCAQSKQRTQDIRSNWGSSFPRRRTDRSTPAWGRRVHVHRAWLPRTRFAARRAPSNASRNSPSAPCSR